MRTSAGLIHGFQLSPVPKVNLFAHTLLVCGFYLFSFKMIAASPGSSSRKKAEFRECTRRLSFYINKGGWKSNFSFCLFYNRVTWERNTLQMKIGFTKIECLPYRHRIENENVQCKKLKDKKIPIEEYSI